MICDKRYWVRKVNCCLIKLYLVGFLCQVQRYSSPIYISNIFGFLKINHFCSVFNWPIEKDFNSKVFFENASSFVVIYSNVIEKKHGYMKKCGIFAVHWCFAHINKIDPSFCFFFKYYQCVLNMNWFENISSLIAIMHIVQKLQAENFWRSSSK